MAKRYNAWQKDTWQKDPIPQYVDSSVREKEPEFNVSEVNFPLIVKIIFHKCEVINSLPSAANTVTKWKAKYLNFVTS